MKNLDDALSGVTKLGVAEPRVLVLNKLEIPIQQGYTMRDVTSSALDTTTGRIRS